MSEYCIELPFPPSLNTYWRNWNGRMVISNSGREYSSIVSGIVRPLLGPENPLKGRLSIEVNLHRGDRRSFDIDNSIKVLCDSLTKCGFWEDDSQIDEITIRRKALLKPGRVYILIKEV